MEMRNNVADAVKDRLHLIASAGSTTTFIDPIELTDFDDTLAGAQMLVTTGSNAGSVVRVVSNSLSAFSLTFTPDLPNPIVEGDEADLFNLSNKGFRVQQYNNAIKTIVSGRGYKNVVESSYTFDTEFDADDPDQVIPDSFIGIYDVHADIGYNLITPVRYTPWRMGNGWFVDTANRTLSIWGSQGTLIHGGTLTIFGYEAVEAPTTDDGQIFLDEEYVRWACIAQLCMNKSPAHDRWAAEAITNMRQREQFVTPILHRNTQFLTESSS
jgi:hypothetical protein